MAISAEFRNVNVAIVSRHPLLGVLEFASSTGETVEVVLDRPNAEALISALALFLMHDNEALPNSPDASGDFSL